MVKEFVNFKKYEDIAKKLVNRDNVTLSSHMYTKLNMFTSKVSIVYYSNFWKAYNEITYRKVPTIFVTKIQLYNQDTDSIDSYHAVALLKHKDDLYMFDPNGVVTKKNSTLLYMTPDGIMDGAKLTKKFGIRLPKYYGIQYIGKESPPGYINGGGYCMFYLFLGLKYTLTKYERSKKSLIEVCSSITDLEKEKLLKKFPSDIHIQTAKILDFAFKELV